MILEELGVLSTAQDLTAGATDSENVIDLGTVANVGFGEVWLSIITETVATGDGSDTYQFQLVLSEETTLDTNVEVLSVTVTGVSDGRIAAVNRNIAKFEIGQHLADLVDGTKRYLGLISTISAGATISINADLSVSKPRTKDDTQVTRSNVGVPS